MALDSIEVGYGYWTIGRTPRWWPLMPGPLHEDREYFGLSALHRHVHPAYLTESEYRATRGGAGWPHDVWIAPLCRWADPRTGQEIARLDTDASGKLTPNVPAQPRNRSGDAARTSWSDDRLTVVQTFCIRRTRRKRRRPMPPHPFARSPGFEVPAGFTAMVAAYSAGGETAEAPEGICPHRGADLTGLEPDADGTVVCPQHGLS